jgi:hypothetical protein
MSRLEQEAQVSATAYQLEAGNDAEHLTSLCTDLEQIRPHMNLCGRLTGSGSYCLVID